MMKKLLYILGLLMLTSLVAGPIVSYGAEQFSGKDEDVPFSTARIFSKLVESTGANPAADWTTTFGAKDEKDVGKDLYLTVYRKVLVQPNKDANKAIAGKYGIPEGEMTRFAYGDISLLLDKKPGLTFEEAQSKISEIQQQLLEEKDLQALQAEIKAAVEPNEMFANGDLDDSGFDLINDLTLIEQLLFLKTSPIDVGAGYIPVDAGGGSGSSGPGTPAGGPTGAAGASGTGGTSSTTASGQSSTSASSSTGVPTSPTTPESTVTKVGGVAPTEEELNANSCFASAEYNNALAAFENKKQSDPNLKDKSKAAGAALDPLISPTGISGAAKPGAGTGTPTGTEIENIGQTSSFLTIKVEPNIPVKPAPADKWLKDKTCIGVFCIYIEKISKPATSAFKNSDNCIACHAEKINDVLKVVINHSLAPNKVPGNLGESAKCKKPLADLFGSINMNVYAISNPIKTPINDDLVYGKNIEDDWYNYCNAVAFPFSCRKEDAPKKESDVKYEIPATIQDTSAKKAIVMAAETATQGDVARDINIAVEGYSLQRVQELNKYQLGNLTDRGAGTFRPLLTEMENMNYYFTSIRDILHSLHEQIDNVTGPQACQDIKDKKECS